MIVESYIRNCILKTKGEVLFTGVKGQLVASLDGYAVIPIEDYEALQAKADKDIAAVLT